MQLSAPAKINLSFRIIGRRADGFHEIDSLMAPIGLADELVVERDETRPGISFECDDPSLPADVDNLVVRAAARLLERIGKSGGVRIALRKRIPHGAGLGGGSSDAAATLLAISEVFGASLAPEELLELAAGLGSDVPFFLAQSSARCRGRGEIVIPSPLPRRLQLLLAKPEFGVPTPAAYARWRDSRELVGIDYAPQLFEEVSFENDLERPVFEKFPFLARLKMWLREQPEVGAALLSGSGSTVFAVLRDGADAHAIAQRIKDELDPRLWTCAAATL
ncbi:MAG: 4-(cytidine 5'-diphospho)-2-C-methyl-D-erythritol kinase [Chthoniobacterales bacterium]